MVTIGILGGMGPAATVDFLDKLVALTPARRDQDHLPLVVACLPQVPDRSDAILGRGPDPWPQLRRGIDLLNGAGVDLVAVPCNTAHHWHAAMCAHARAPVLHIAQACVERLRQPPGAPVLVMASRGVHASGFYARALQAAGLQPLAPGGTAGEAAGPATGITPLQAHVDACIARVKAGAPEAAGESLAQALRLARATGAACAILACTELPIAARHCGDEGLALVDSTRALAQAVVAHALALARGGLGTPAQDALGRAPGAAAANESGA